MKQHWKNFQKFIKEYVLGILKKPCQNYPRLTKILRETIEKFYPGFIDIHQNFTKEWKIFFGDFPKILNKFFIILKNP